ncbi:hypothetical protein [Candidatus Neptunochlamydia vexilliferae]|uniref:Uncharacterized protein n=1 Tax=Candidatus Neptunichlamydia vexilliferae TaxID=1651774 RepID=A0ABS0AZ06_9BACT|nr:hypothetical protein [Candidatus Neptunochlamydia vexilliferae]MBF5059372.1 hypothetical protein [Candidatus Neptunochlamydia vexilliferae]
MSSINWPEVLAILAAFGGAFAYMMNRLDGLRKELNNKIENVVDKAKKELKSEIKDLDKKIDAVEKDVHQVYSKVSNIEGQMIQMTRPNIIPITRHHEKPLDDDGQNVQEC